MRKRNPWLMVVVALGVLSLAQIACGAQDPPTPPGPGDDVQLPAAARGGGWILSGDGKATFGFQLTCDSETGNVQGQFQFRDHARGVGFHGVLQDHIDGCTVTIPSDIPETEPMLAYKGQYTPQPKNAGDQGDLLLKLGEQSCLSITLTGGAHDGYALSGCLEKGNIRIWGWME